ncbi:hypothetical protein PSHT_14105 [Puccinia striiformis]|uniref:Uncharacterized protein n=1 Tax=Puccinia striiformis TaxID=27350 RepID=A0A2S4UM75_9BASI|nr:hypothetical protein PSHT_14094 [Puccinia striiformis]POV98307.1 hypothetical protein PSHT_14105 [Puccinia striiformis]
MNEAANNSRVDKLTTTVNNGIDAARFDTLLPRSVTGESQEVIKNYFKQMKSRVELIKQESTYKLFFFDSTNLIRFHYFDMNDQIISNYQLKSLVGPVATTSQITHIEICNTLSDLSCILVGSIAEEYQRGSKR